MALIEIPDELINSLKQLEIDKPTNAVLSRKGVTFDLGKSGIAYYKNTRGQFYLTDIAIEILKQSKQNKVAE